MLIIVQLSELIGFVTLAQRKHQLLDSIIPQVHQRLLKSLWLPAEILLVIHPIFQSFSNNERVQ